MKRALLALVLLGVLVTPAFGEGYFIEGYLAGSNLDIALIPSSDQTTNLPPQWDSNKIPVTFFYLEYGAEPGLVGLSWYLPVGTGKLQGKGMLVLVFAGVYIGQEGPGFILIPY